jgi:divinyl protochlorophyllide a 8-vinyl-reductase
MAAAATSVERASGARIGPNAITRVAEMLRVQAGHGTTAAVFESAGLAHFLRELPTQMVDEAEVARLHAAVRRELGSTRAPAVLHEAGLATARYLLAHRIPRPLQWLLHRVPARLAARILFGAIARHAWTFVGSGRFAAPPPPAAAAASPVWIVEIRDNPLCRGVREPQPVCAFYAGTFEGLFRALVHEGCRVQEIECEACGGEACRLQIRVH